MTTMWFYWSLFVGYKILNMILSYSTFLSVYTHNSFTALEMNARCPDKWMFRIIHCYPVLIQLSIPVYIIYTLHINYTTKLRIFNILNWLVCVVYLYYHKNCPTYFSRGNNRRRKNFGFHFCRCNIYGSDMKFWCSPRGGANINTSIRKAWGSSQWGRYNLGGLCIWWLPNSWPGLLYWFVRSCRSQLPWYSWMQLIVASTVLIVINIRFEMTWRKYRWRWCRPSFCGLLWLQVNIQYLFLYTCHSLVD